VWLWLQERQKLEHDKSLIASEAAAEAAAAQAAAQQALRREALQFQTPQGRAVFDAVFKPPQHNRLLVREMFQPRRTAFVFEFEEGSGDVPTTLRRSKADCPPVLVRGAVDPQGGGG
jgi:predicted aminopeptidase